MNRRTLLLGAIALTASGGPALAFGGREVVDFETPERPGTLIVNNSKKALYRVLGEGLAMHYPVTLGKEGHDWAGGPENPLGARALYLFTGGRDTLFRIHGTNEPQSIGRAASSGCIRMLNAHIEGIYEQTPLGTKVIVL